MTVSNAPRGDLGDGGMSREASEVAGELWEISAREPVKEKGKELKVSRGWGRVYIINIKMQGRTTEVGDDDIEAALPIGRN